MEKENKKIKSKIVQTYAEDMAKVIEAGSGGGLLKKIIHGEEEHEIEKALHSPQSKRNQFFMLMGVLLILAGLGTLVFFFLHKSVINTVEPEKQFTPLIFNDRSTFLEVKDFKKEQIVQTILNEINTTELKNGGVEGIYFTEDKQVVGLRRFISLIKANFTPNNDPVLVSDNFLTGVVNNNEQKDFFILLKVRSLPDIFSSLRAWEGKMFSDLYEFWGIDIVPETKYLLTKNFEDTIIENKNARVIYDQDNKIVMMYIFANDNSVIITNTESAAHEVMLRLSSSQIKK